ncbi:MAG: hypothetical protein PHU42_03165 [Patescibacteria group bacterium]|nr:hypothetical protein [Patescibacteria group bacterium]
MAKLKKLVYSIAVFAIVLGSVVAFSAPKSALAAPAYDYQLISQSAYPATLAPGATTNVFIEVKNTGTATWQSNVRLGSGSAYGAANQQRDYNSEFADLSAGSWLSANRPCGMSNGGPVSNILPGWVVRFQFNIKAPMNNGTYKAYFTPVADGVTWMKDIGIFWQITVSGGTNPNNPPVVNPTTPMTVGLSSDTPASANIPRGARGVTFTKLVVNGGSSAANINTLTVKRIGAGAPGDFDNVYLYDGDNRLTTGKSINTSSNEVVFGALNLSIPANSQKILSIVGDIAAGAGQGNSSAFEVESAAKIIGAAFTGNFPIIGSYMTNANALVGQVTVTKSGSITDPKIGEQGVQIAEFNVQATGTEDITVRRIALTNLGSVSSTNLTGLALKLNNGTPVATSTGFVNDIATFVLSTPLVITNGSNKIFQLFANVTGRVNDTIKIDIDNDADIYATGNTYGYGVSVVRTGYDNSIGAADASWSTLLGGTITITSSGPQTADMGQNLTDKALLNLAIASGANAEVRTLTIKITGTDLLNNGGLNNTAYFTNIKVSDSNGNIVVGPKELTTGGANGGALDLTQTLAFTDRFTLTAGQTLNLVVSANVSSVAPALSTIHADLVAFGATDIKSLDTNDYITDIVPSTDIVGKTMTVKVSGLAVSLASTPATQIAVVNKQNVDTVGFLLTAGTASAVTVTSIMFTGYIDGNNNGVYNQTSGGVDGGKNLRDVISSVTLFNATTGLAVGTSKALATDGTVNFTGLAIPIAASGTVKLVPRVNIDSPTLAVGEKFYFDIPNAAAGITSQDSNNANITETGDGANAAPGVIVNLSNVGTLTAATSAATPTTTIAQAGLNDVEFTRAKFYAVNESFTIQTLQVKNASATDINLAGVSLTYTNAGEASTTVSGYISGQAITFTGLTVKVPKDGNIEVVIKANMNTISGGAVSGAAPELDINYGVANDGTDFKAIGNDSSVVLNQLTNPATDIAGQAMVVRKTKPVISTTSTTGTLAGGINIYSMSINAGSGADASFKQFKFDISASLNVTAGDGLGTISSIQVWKDGVQVPAADLNVVTAGGTVTSIDNGEVYLVISWKTGKELVVAQGTSSTIVVKGTTNVATSSSFTAALAAENVSTVETGDVTNTAGTANVFEIGGTADRSIIWSDNSSASHNSTVPSTSADWSNGYPLKDLPGNSFSYTHGA